MTELEKLKIKSDYLGLLCFELIRQNAVREQVPNLLLPQYTRSQLSYALLSLKESSDYHSKYPFLKDLDLDSILDSILTWNK